MFYYLIFLCILFLVLVENSIPDHTKNTNLKINLLRATTLFLLFIGGFRWKTGNDWYNYEIMFNKLGDLKDLFTNTKAYIEYYSDIELGYRILNSIIKSIGLGFQSILLLTNLFLMYTLYYFIKKHSKKYMLSLLLYYSIFFLHFNMSLIRQGIALSFFMISIDMIMDQNLLKFLITVLIGALFHISILIVIPVYFLRTIKISKGNLLIILFVSYIIRILNISISSMIFFILPDFITSDLVHYINTYQNVSFFTFGNLERFIMAIVLIFTYEKLVKINKDNILYFNIYIIYLLFNLLLFENIGILTRIRFYFQLQYIIIIPILLGLLKDNFSKMIAYIYVFSLSIIPLVNFLNGYVNSILYNPYKNYIINKIIMNEEFNGDEKYERIIDYVLNGGE